MSRDFNPEGCMAANVCMQTYLDGPKCGSQERHLSPLALAEDLCVDALKGRLAQERNDRAGDFWRAKALKDLSLAWQEAEVGMHPATPNRPITQEKDPSGRGSQYVEDRFERAGWHADKVLDNKMRLCSDGLSAAQLLLYRPILFSKQRGSWGKEDYARIRFGVASMVQPVWGATLHPPQKDAPSVHHEPPKSAKHHPCFSRESDRQSTLTQLGGQQLCLRAGLPVTPGAVRETGAFTETPKQRAAGHRLYIPGKHSKLPLKVGLFDPENKRTEVFSRSGLYIAFGGLMKQTAESMGAGISSLTDLTRQTITALTREAKQQSIGAFDHELLEGMTKRLLDQVHAYADNPSHPFTLQTEGLDHPA